MSEWISLFYDNVSAHPWLNWVDEGDDEGGLSLSQNTPPNYANTYKEYSKLDPKHLECEQTK